MKSTKRNARTAVVKGRVTVDGIRTTFAADGKTVADQQVIVKLNRGILSKRFWVPLSLLDIKDVMKVMTETDEEGFPQHMELTFVDVTKVPGRVLTYEAKVASVVTPLPDKTLTALASSKTLVEEPQTLRIAK